MTPEATQSKWVRFEAGSALEDAVQGTMAFVPLLVKSCRAPRLWRRYQRISFTRNRYDVGLRQLLRRLGDTTATDGDAVGAQRAAPLPRPTARDETLEPMTETPTPKTRIEVVQPPDHKPLIPDHLLPAGDPSQYKILSGNRILWLKDGKEMVLAPAGKFLYGEDKQEIDLPAFWMNKTPVTNEEYKRFIDANHSYSVPFANVVAYAWDEKKRTYPQDKEKHPMVYVTWHDAKAYAEWAGKVLPTEQQWEKAARGTDGRIYPWGNQWQQNHCNSGESGIGGTSPVGQFSPLGDSPYGCVDMSGNVSEWTDSWWDAKQVARVRRGGSWNLNLQNARADDRNGFDPYSRYHNYGFRVCAPTGSGS